jgi:hypothetical protein
VDIIGVVEVEMFVPKEFIFNDGIVVREEREEGEEEEDKEEGLDGGVEEVMEEDLLLRER